MKMKFFLFTTTLFVCCVIRSKAAPPVDSVLMGYDYILDREIYGNVVGLPAALFRYEIDPVTSTLVCAVRSTNKKETKYKRYGSIIGFDVESNEPRWQTEMDYQTYRVVLADGFAIRSKVAGTGYSACYDYQTGSASFETASVPYMVLQEHDLALCLPPAVVSDRQVYGVTGSGERLWKRNIPLNYGLNGSVMSNDSTIIIAANGLYSLDLGTGEGWEYKATTHAPNRAAQGRRAAATGFGILSGLLTGSYMIPIGGSDRITGICSNMATSGDTLFWASREFLSCIYMPTGDHLWYDELPVDKMSSSSVFIDDSTVYFLNKGRMPGYFYGMGMDYGEAFVAAYDRWTGDKKFTSYSDLPITSVLLDEERDEFFQLSDTRLSKRSLVTGEELGYMVFEFGDSIPAGTVFARNDMFFADVDDTTRFSALGQMYDDNFLFVLTNEGEIVVIGREDFSVSETIAVKNAYLPYHQAGDYLLAGSFEKTVILDADGVKIADIDAGRRAAVAGRYLLDVGKRNFVRIDLSRIFPYGLDFEGVTSEGITMDGMPVFY